MDTSQIVALYKRMLQNDSELRRLKRQISSGDLAALQEYGVRSGQLSVNALQKGIADGIADQNDLINMLDGVFRENYQAVANASQTALKVANQAAGLGLNGSESDYVNTAVQFADKLSGYDDISEGLNSLTNDIVLQSQRYADDSERRSAEFASDSGLEVLVTREYDDVGVHTTDKGGGEVCHWCLDRCGIDVPYQEAYDRGMFERHPGCGCIITYKTKKRMFRQGKGDWEHNQWAEVTEQERNSRIEAAERKPYSDHINQRKRERGASDKTIESIIKNPLHKTEIYYDEYGRATQNYIGNKFTVVVNPETGTRVTVRRTTKSEREKWKK